MNKDKEFADKYIELCNELNPLWNNGKYSIIAGTHESASFNVDQSLTDAQGEKINDNSVRLSQFGNILVEIFKEANKEKKINHIEFLFQNRLLVEIRKSWDQAAHEESIKYYSKAKLEKLKAWYLPDDNPPSIQKTLEVLPKQGIKMDITELTLDKAFHELNKVVIYQDDPLWDGGYYSITYNKEGWSGEADLYLYDSLESKERELGADEVKHTLVMTDEIKKLFLYIQDSYKAKNPTTPYDSLFVTVQKDGVNYVTNFEFEGNEVYPTAPPKPDVIDAGYLCENLQNCLSHHAPDNYQWVWEVLKKSQTEDGKTQLEGNFFYSLNEDKSDPQELEPGEYMYMYNVSERLFDEFFPETKGWKEIALYFSAERKVSYSVQLK